MKDFFPHQFDCVETLSAEVRSFHLKDPFKIAHGVSSERSVLRFSALGGFGEAPFVPYYDDSPEVALGWMQREMGFDCVGSGLRKVLQDFETQSLAALKPESWCEFWHSAPRVVRLAWDTLQHDLAGKASELPVWRLLRQPDPKGVPCCRSLGIPSDLSEFSDKIRYLARKFWTLKLKLGSGNLDFDEAIVATAREAAPDAVLFGDANGGWSAGEAAKVIPKLAQQGLAFVEQPVSREGGGDAWLELHAALGSRGMPLFADESVQCAGDVLPLVGLVHGINVKLLKTNGFSGALELIETARSHGMQVLLGCMVESSIGVTAAAHLAGLADWVDLDGHLYLAEDDFEGIEFANEGRLRMPTRAGIGAVRRSQATSQAEASRLQTSPLKGRYL